MFLTLDAPILLVGCVIRLYSFENLSTNDMYDSNKKMSKLHLNFSHLSQSPTVNHASRHQFLQIMILGHFAADCLMYKCPFGKRDGTLDKWTSTQNLALNGLKGFICTELGLEKKKNSG